MISNTLAGAFSNIMNKAGRQIRIDYFNPVFDPVYDEPDDTIMLSGTLWTSGIVLPINNRRGSEDSVLLEQGKVQEKDKKLYVNGSTFFTGQDQMVKVQLGSPTGDVYSTIPLGGNPAEVQGIEIYKRQYLRFLPTGSF